MLTSSGGLAVGAGTGFKGAVHLAKDVTGAGADTVARLVYGEQQADASFGASADNLVRMAAGLARLAEAAAMVLVTDDLNADQVAALEGLFEGFVGSSDMPWEYQVGHIVGSVALPEAGTRWAGSTARGSGILRAARESGLGESLRAAGNRARTMVSEAVRETRLTLKALEARICRGGKKRAPAAKTATQGKTVLGHYPAYKDLAEQLGARRFNIPTEYWNKMSPVEQWAANQKFLDRMVARGDEVILATPLDKVKPGSFFERELQYLQTKGFKPSADGTRMIPGGGN